jgi:fumarate hydratase class I
MYKWYNHGSRTRIADSVMLNLRQGIIELYRKVARSIPPDVEAALVSAREKEDEGSQAERALREVLETIKLAREGKRPVCLDTGIPVFYVKIPKGLSHGEIRSVIMEATREATVKVPLSPNAVDILTNRNTGDNTGVGFPVIHLEESEGSSLVVDLMLKGSWSENEGRLYRLPDERLNAERDLEGITTCVIDAVKQAGGRGCPPYTVGVGVGGTIDQVTSLSQEQLRRKIDDKNLEDALDELERACLAEINDLGVGIMGLGGKSTALGVKIGVQHRHPDSYFVDVALACWSNRRGKLVW